MATITEIKGIKNNQIYECVADFNDPFDKEHSFKKGDLVFGDDLNLIDETNKQFFKLVGAKGVTHKINKEKKITKIARRPVEVGDVIFVKFARIKYKNVVVLDVLEDCQMASVYPTSIGYLPLGALAREEHKGWIGVNYKLEFDVPVHQIVSNEDSLGE